MKGRGGFTLIEIMIAIAIVGIVAIIATTNFQLWLSHNSAIDFQRELLAQFQAARTRSMATNLQHRLLMNLDAETVALQRGNAGTGSTNWDGTGSALTGSKGAGIYNITYPPGGTTVNAGSFAFLFNPDGQVLAQPDPANSAVTALTQAYIRLSSDSAADHSTILLYGWTSKARLADGWL